MPGWVESGTLVAWGYLIASSVRASKAPQQLQMNKRHARSVPLIYLSSQMSSMRQPL
jgi:hypothetical protein